MLFQISQPQQPTVSYLSRTHKETMIRKKIPYFNDLVSLNSRCVEYLLPKSLVTFENWALVKNPHFFIISS